MIRMVYEQASKALDSVFVATDDERIYKAVLEFGGRVVMTSAAHRSGTDRCAEAAAIAAAEGSDQGIIINIQGDEPFIRPEQISLLKECFSDETVEIATLIRRAAPDEDLFNASQPKVIVNAAGDAIYFSRAVIPYVRDYKADEWSARHVFYKHIGLYAYRTDTLLKITSLPQSSLEIAESLEQNRWLENGFRIRTAVTEWESLGIDTPEDLEKAKHITFEL
jgi:3-deoxy-manno-octulosonate cytidylyltransferase (CMP-KDO synthetase)